MFELQLMTSATSSSHCRQADVSQKCQDEAVNRLAVCFDSLPVRVGCCAKDCAAGLEEVRRTSAKSSLFASRFLLLQEHC